jgi:hypothetical protein
MPSEFRSRALRTPQDLLAKLQDEFLRLRRAPGDPYAAFDFFTAAAHLPSWIEVAGGPNACGLPPTPLLKAAWQIADGEAPLRLVSGGHDGSHLVVELEGWPARQLGTTPKVLDLASQILVYWETLDVFPATPED